MSDVSRMTCTASRFSTARRSPLSQTMRYPPASLRRPEGLRRGNALYTTGVIIHKCEWQRGLSDASQLGIALVVEWASRPTKEDLRMDVRHHTPARMKNGHSPRTRATYWQCALIGDVRSQYCVCTSSKPAGKVNHRAPGNEFDSARTSRFVKARASGSPPRILPRIHRRGTRKVDDGVGLPRSEEEGSRHSLKRDRRGAGTQCTVNVSEVRASRRAFFW
jgi:hypothetical protein